MSSENAPGAFPLVDDLAGPYTETLTFDEASERFQRARRFYEAVQEGSRGVVGELKGCALTAWRRERARGARTTDRP